MIDATDSSTAKALGQAELPVRSVVKHAVDGVMIMPDNPDPESPVFLGGGTRPDNRLRGLSDRAGIRPQASADTGEQHGLPPVTAR